MMMDLEPITVWMVHLERELAGDEVKGTLVLQAGGLLFTDAAHQVPTALPFAAIRKARRLKASPVLMVEWDRGAGAARTAFYFNQPPPLRQPESGTTALPGDPYVDQRRIGAFGAMRKSGKRRHMRENIRYLQTTGIGKKELIQAWADEVSERVSMGPRT